MKRVMTNRRGASLAEVLVAVVVLSIGLTSVVALFPVGISRIRNATLDTRTTIIAANAINLFDIKRMANDPGIVDWPIYDNLSSFISDWNRLNPLTPVSLSQGQLLDDPFRNPLSFVPYAPSNSGWGGVTPSDSWALNNPSHPYTGPIRSTTNLTALGAAADMVNSSLYFISASGDSVLYPGSPTFNAALVTDANPGFDYSYPVLLDPWLYDQMAFQFGMMDGTGAFPYGVPRIPIATAFKRADGTDIPGLTGYYGPYITGGGIAPYCDIAVLSLSEITLIPALPVNFDREMVKTRWFSSTSDLQYSSDTPGQLQNPSSSDSNSLVVQNYYEGLPVNRSQPLAPNNPILATASRSYEYTWAAMFQRKLVTDPLGIGAVARPNPNDREFRGKVSIMCFYRRNLQQPYTVIEGCFYNGSRRATLSWPSNYGSAPTINIGTWLCEASVGRSTWPTGDLLLGSCGAISGRYTGLDLDSSSGSNVIKRKRIYRRSYSFHQVTDVTEPLISGNRVYVQVTLARPALGFPLRYQNPATGFVGGQSGQDERGIDPYPATVPTGMTVFPSWPIVDRLETGPTTPTLASPNFDDETNCSQADLTGIARTDYSFYFPVIIFDGLREVFEYER